MADAHPTRVSADQHQPQRARKMRPDQAFRWETELEQVQAHLGVAIGFGLIGIGLTVLLVGLLWSATRRLRNLPNDPRSLRVLIVVGLAISALGVVIGAIGAATS